MKPKDKAKQLVKFYGGEKDKMGALRCVLEIMNANPHSNPFSSVRVHSTIVYWDLVRKEIEKL